LLVAPPLTAPPFAAPPLAVVAPPWDAPPWDAPPLVAVMPPLVAPPLLKPSPPEPPVAPGASFEFEEHAAESRTRAEAKRRSTGKCMRERFPFGREGSRDQALEPAALAGLS
jgi:hypothetical protein